MPRIAITCRNSAMCLAAGSWLFPWVSAQLPSPCLGELALLMLFVLLSMFAQAMSRCTSRGEICGHSRVCHLIRKFDLRRTSEQQTWSDADADFGALKKSSEITLDFLAHLENLSKFLREQYCSLPPDCRGISACKNLLVVIKYAWTETKNHCSTRKYDSRPSLQQRHAPFVPVPW
jgi:hypothetical protein